MIKKMIIVACMIMISYFIHVMQTVEPLALITKYVLLAYGCSAIGYLIAKRFIKKKNELVALLGVLLLILFTILTMDTFLIHAIHFFPGILRYPIYSLYGIAYLIFILPGILIGMRKQQA